MTPDTGRILAVEDDPLALKILKNHLESQGHDVETAPSGVEALEKLRSASVFDVVLLDIVMPRLDGYQTLERIKADEALRHIPVIMISGIDDLSSVVRCIEMGAADYLQKPFDRAILQARLKSSLAGKRLRDLELEYLEQVGHVISAAGAVEANTFDPADLQGVAARDDALGQLARTFQRMALEVRAREERLRQEVRELRIEIDERRQTEKVAEITGTDYFKDLRDRAQELRRIVANPGSGADSSERDEGIGEGT
ncbi:MAG TPA: response regulator [Actinomycetota bacterium]|nr:response regulator [Actinomycetota bacterium]